MITSRNHYSPQEKSSIVVRGLSHRGTIKEFCTSKGIPESCYYDWRAKFIKAGIESFSDCSRKASQRAFMTVTSPRMNSAVLDERAAARQQTANEITRLLNPGWPRFVRLTEGQKSQIITIVRSAPGPVRKTLEIAAIPRSSFYRWEGKTRNSIASANHQENRSREKLTGRADVRERFFAVFHSPPSQHGFNRTTWRVADLQSVLKASGTPLGRHAIRTIIRSAGYRWRKARKVLTSGDPDYRAKLDNIHSILRNLGPNEGFFSVDEYGPFAVRCREGRKLVAPGENPSVPQWQKSKGVIIVTAALELSTNQVTHFYSQRKLHPMR